MTRYSGAEHGFTVWGQSSYNPWAEGRSFQSYEALLNARMPAGFAGSANTLGASLIFSIVAVLATFLMV